MTTTQRSGKRFADWTEELPRDVLSTFELITNEAIAPQGRRFLVGALSYTLTQFDLIPDHERGGSVDDAFVLRIAYGLCAEHAAELGIQEAALMARFTNEEEQVREFLGEALFAKLRRLVMEQSEKEIRGRTAAQVLTDSRARELMKRELDAAMKRVRPDQVATDADADALEVSVRSYLKAKLG
jgi:uncharacterized membrane protein YkvA (DUF1232 family)